MKVLHIIPSVSPVRGGPSQAVLEMVRALRLQGVEAAIATTDDDGDRVLDVPLRQWIEYEGVPVQFFPRFSPSLPPLREFAFSAHFTHWMLQHLRDYDLIHVHAIFSYASTAAMAIARAQRVPYLVRPLGQLCHWSLQQGSRKKALYLRLIEQANLNHSQALHFTSEQERQEAAPLQLQVPSFVLPHGLTLPAPIPNARAQLRQRLHLPHDGPIVLFLSRLHPKKGLEYLIPALSQFRHLPFTLILAGSGAPEYEAELRQLICQSGLADRVCHAGFVTGELKNLLLQGSDLFALTSHSENFGVAVLEAMAAGLPVLLSPGVALATVVERERVGWVTPLEPPVIAAALQHFFQNPDQARQRGERACQVVSHQFTWNSVARQLGDRYQALAQGDLVAWQHSLFHP